MWIGETFNQAINGVVSDISVEKLKQKSFLYFTIARDSVRVEFNKLWFCSAHPIVRI